MCEIFNLNVANTLSIFFFFFNDTATTEIYTLSLHDALPISGLGPFLVKLTYKHPVCGNVETYDTIIILGPLSAIESAFQRVPDWQTFQCAKDVMDTVYFTRNLSKFYPNDLDYTDDDSTF